MPAVIAPLIAEAAIAAPAAAGLGAAGLGSAALGASGLAALPSIVSPAVAGIGAGALESGLSMGLGTGLASLAPGVSAAANLLSSAVPAAQAAAPLLSSSLASAAPGVASTVGQAASGLGSAGGLPTLAQTAGYNAAGFAQPFSQTANMLNATDMMAKTAPALNMTEGVPMNAFPGPEATGQIADFSKYTGQNLPPIEASPASNPFANLVDKSKLGDVVSQTIEQTGPGPQSAGYQGPTASTSSPVVAGQTWSKNLMNLLNNPSMQGAKDYVAEHPYASAMGAYNLYNMLNKPKPKEQNLGLIRPYTFNRTQNPDAYAPSSSTAERSYFTDSYTAGTPYKAPGAEYKASGGLTSLAVGGPVETMSAMNAVGGNSMYPQADYQTAMYSNPMMQRPMPSNVINAGVDANVDPYTGEQRFAGGGISSLRPASMNKRMAAVDMARAKMQNSQGQVEMEKAARNGDRSALLALQQAGYDLNDLNQYASGGISNLGGYSDGGRLLKGPGDGVSDSIPAVIGNRQPARLADGEFVVPARIVSELGNGSTDAGAKKLYAMMDRVQKARRRTVGKDRVAANTKSEKYLPA